jgi:hypothetical protein
MFPLSIMSNKQNKERVQKKYVLLLVITQIAESDTVLLVHGPYESDDSHSFKTMTQAKAYSLYALTMFDPSTHHILVHNFQSHK